MEKPNSKAHLDAAIQRLAGTKTREARFSEIRAIVADTVVSQMLSGCAIKGGGSLKLRYGEGQTRFTMDLDAATAMRPDVFIDTMRKSLAAGWDDFTGTLTIERPASPHGVPAEYVMRPFLVRLDYHGKSWCSVRLEISHNEIGDADDAELVPPAADIVGIFAELGLPEPKPMPLMRLEFQIAQKIHGVSAPGSTRVRDLIDLQLIMRNSVIDLANVKQVCVRLFAYRKTHNWQPTLSLDPRWINQYDALRGDLPVLASLDEAIAWTNDLICQIDAAQR
jgi:hypothetical protein